MKTTLSPATLAEATLADVTTVPAPARAGRNRRAWPTARSLGRVGWARPGLLGLLALTAVFYLWGLGRNGNANDFYAAAVKAGTESWKAFFFGSFDAANYITVDKPPASLWVMELSGRVFGFSSWSMLVPQALEGVAAVGLLYATVRRWFSPAAALASGLVLAVTPVAALMFRFNNPDALLVLLLVAAAYATVRAVETAGTRWLALAGGALGLAFLTKMFQAFLVVPAFALVYLVAAPAPLRRRLWQLVVAGCALVVSSGWWVAVVALTPAADRPYVGGSTNNSILDLILGYNGLGRITGNEAGGGGGGAGGPQFSGSPGLTRLFNSLMGGQISWLLPAALLALPIGIWLTWRAPRTDRHRAALIMWGGWLLVTGIVYSYAGGIIHTYYTNTLAPAIAALVGITAVGLWQRRSRLAARLALGALLVATAVWSYVLLERTPGWHPWLRWAVVAGGTGVAIAIAVAGGRLHRFALAGLVAAGALSALGGPLAYTVSTVANAQSGAVVAAGPASASGGPGGGFAGGRGFAGSSASRPAGASGFPSGGSGNGAAAGTSGPPMGTRPFGTRPTGAAGRAGGGGAVSRALVALLKQGAGSYTWVAATTSSSSAAPIELATGKAVMAIGGFTGSDPSTTLAQFRRLVAEGKIHYYLASGGGGRPGGGNSSSSITSWVTSRFKAVTVGGTTLYDLTKTSS